MQKLRNLVLSITNGDGFDSFTDTEIGRVFVAKWRPYNVVENTANLGPTECGLTSTYHRHTSRVMGAPYVTLRTAHPGGWDDPRWNDFDAEKPDRYTQRQIAAILLHELSHHLCREMGKGVADVGQYENEEYAWKEARLLWEMCELENELGSFPDGFAAECLSTYEN